MKQRTTKIIALVAMALLAVSTAFAQGVGWREGGSNLNITNPSMVKADEKKGADWEIITHNNVEYSYFKGNAKIDSYKTTTESTLLGFHWMGHEVSEVEDEILYLCNVATGEYMLIGEYWGETGMINHAGLQYKLVKGYPQRAKQKTVFGEWPETEGYFIQPLGVREGRVIGRMNRNDGKPGHFEYNKFLAMRDMDEYDDGYRFNPLTNNWVSGYNAPADPANGDADDAINPGGFLFQFYPVQGEKGEQEYVIYTHRKTDILQNPGGRYNPLINRVNGLGAYQYIMRSEYYDRDSYLMLTNAGPITADYNSVRFVKFAGDMGTSGTKTATISNGTQATTTFGTYNTNANNAFVTTYAASGLQGVRVVTDANIMSNAYVNNDKYGHAMVFSLPDGYKEGSTVKDTIRITAPAGYKITGYHIEAIATDARWFTVFTEGDETGTKVSDERVTIEKTGLDTESTVISFYQGGDHWQPRKLYFPVFTVTLTGGQLGDETKHPSGTVISLEDGLAAAAADPNNRWKLVTKTERDRFRLVASEDQPVDVSSRIVNPKFYTTFTYNWKAEDCTGPDGDGHYTHANDKTAYGWQWYDHDTMTHPDGKHHVHPYDADYSNHWTTKQEHHKIGTGHFWRTGSEGISLNGGQEFELTEGQEANYCGSIFKGSANVQQTISGLREGLYVVYVRGFYAPHDMTKYTIGEWGNASTYKMGEDATTSAAPELWAKQAYFTDTSDDNKIKWQRSHDSYLFAWSNPKGEGQEEVRRMLPSIYEGAVRMTQLGKISRNEYINSEAFEYTQLGHRYKNRTNSNGLLFDDAGYNTELKKVELMLDENIFAIYKSNFFDMNNGFNWVVPKTVTGAARFFNAVEESLNSENSHKNASNYRIGLPVYVGSDGELTIGVEHYKAEGLSNPDEWVCFDDFELLYMGKVEPNEFVIDEIDGTKEVGPFEMINGYDGSVVMEGGSPKMSTKTKMKNNTQWIDLFNPSNIATDPNFTTVKTVVLRRTMPKDAFSYIVLPVSLTLKHVKEMFGEKAFVSKLDRFSGNTIYYKNQLTGKTDNDIVITAGVPYIVKPSKYPEIAEGSEFKYKRPSFSKAYSATAEGVAGWFLEDPTRNYEIERELAGPIWIATDVEIKSSESFPDMRYEGTPGEGGKAVGNGSIWTYITPFTSSQSFQIEGKPEQGTYKMVETGVYEPGGTIPANSYYHAGGKMYFTTGAVTNLPRGLYSYIQMIRQEDGKAYAKPFVGGDDYFIEVVGGTTGIEDINQPLPDGKMEIYDLQGRKVTNPGRGIYIVNGVKTVFN